MKTNANTPSVIAIPDAIIEIARQSARPAEEGMMRFAVSTNRPVNGVEFYFAEDFYCKPLWNYLKSIGFSPMAKKHMLYLSPKKVSREQYRVAYLIVRKLMRIHLDACYGEDTELRINRTLLVVMDSEVKEMLEAAYPPETKKPAKQASKSRKSTKATKSKATAKAVALPQVAEDIYDVFR